MEVLYGTSLCCLTANPEHLLYKLPLAGIKGQLRWKGVHLQVTTGSYLGNGLTSENHHGIPQSR